MYVSKHKTCVTDKDKSYHKKVKRESCDFQTFNGPNYLFSIWALRNHNQINLSIKFLTSEIYYSSNIKVFRLVREGVMDGVSNSKAQEKFPSKYLIRSFQNFPYV